MLQLAIDHEKCKKKALFCIERGAHKYVREFQLNLERSAEVNVTDTKSVRKLKQEAKKLDENK